MLSNISLQNFLIDDKNSSDKENSLTFSKKNEYDLLRI